MPCSVHPPLGAFPPWVPRDISQHSNIFYLGRLDEIKIQSLPLPQFVKDAGSRINSLHLPKREIFPKWSRSKYFVFILITPDLPKLGGTELEFPNNLAFCFCLLQGVNRELTVADRWKSLCFLVCDKLWTRLLARFQITYITRIPHPRQAKTDKIWNISRCSRLQASYQCCSTVKISHYQSPPCHHTMGTESIWRIGKIKLEK